MLLFKEVEFSSLHFSIVSTFKILSNDLSSGPKESKISSSGTTGSEKEVFAATTYPKCRHSTFLNPLLAHIDIQFMQKSLLQERQGSMPLCTFFLNMMWIALMLIVFGHHEDCVFNVNTHTVGFFLLVFCLDMSSQAILSKFNSAMTTIHLVIHFKCSILLCSLKWA